MLWGPDMLRKKRLVLLKLADMWVMLLLGS